MVGWLEVDQQIHVAVVVESVGEDRTEHEQRLNPVQAAQVGDLLLILSYQIHIERFFGKDSNCL